LNSPTNDAAEVDAAIAPEGNLALLQDEPMERVHRDGVDYLLLGTAHVSKASADAARALAESAEVDAIAVELDSARHQSLTDPDAWRKMDLFEVIKQGKAGLVAANLALGAYQKRLADQFGIEPGAELKAACEVAEKRELPLWLVDRDVGLTLKRAYGAVRFWDKMMLISGMLGSLVFEDTIDEDEIEKLKESDMLERTFSEFASQSEPLYRSLIAERDEFMAAKLRDHASSSGAKSVLAIVGAGHLKGLTEALTNADSDPAEVFERLNQPPPPSIWGKVFSWGMLAVLVSLMGWGFVQGLSTGAEVLTVYVLATGGLAALGALIAGGHPLSALAGGLSAPLTVLHPALASGMFSAGTEVYLRRPTVADFEALKDDVVSFAGWRRNRVARALLVFVITNFATMIGVYTAGFEMFRRLQE